MTTTKTTTQVKHPWRATLRTAGVNVVAVVLFVAAAADPIIDFAHKYLPGPAAAWIAGAVGFVVGLSVLINRVMLLPGFNALLTRLGLGPAPKADE